MLPFIGFYLKSDCWFLCAIRAESWYVGFANLSISSYDHVQTPFLFYFNLSSMIQRITFFDIFFLHAIIYTYKAEHKNGSLVSQKWLLHLFPSLAFKALHTRLIFNSLFLPLQQIPLPMTPIVQTASCL